MAVAHEPPPITAIVPMDHGADLSGMLFSSAFLEEEKILNTGLKYLL